MTIVVGYVPTETGFSAIQEAGRQAQARDVSVVVVNALGPAGYALPTAADERNLDAVSTYLTQNGVQYSVRQVSDPASPADLILGIAQEVQASMIVLGLHQRRRIARELLGSTTRSVVLAAPCPVLIVPDVDKHKPMFGDVDAPPLRSMGQVQDDSQEQ
jgi:nucleotide-binding universal stress UspA family protein